MLIDYRRNTLAGARRTHAARRRLHVLAGFLKLGFLTRFVSAGMTVYRGIAVNIILGQLGDITDTP